jgi:hypothetical protein
MWRLTGERWIHAIIEQLISSDDRDLQEDFGLASATPATTGLLVVAYCRSLALNIGTL